MSNLFYESLELTEDTAYQEIYTDLSVKTDSWDSPYGEVRYSDKTDADIAVSILKDRYPNVKLEPLDYKNGDDLSYHITYSDDTNEEYDQDGLNWLEDKNPKGTPIGIGNPVSGGMGEDYKPGNDYIKCPHCEGEAEYIEGQGNFRFYKCLGCGEYLFVNRKGDVKKADDAFDANGNLLDESLINEANGNDSFEGVQQYFASIHKPEQDEKIEELNSSFKQLGFDIANFEQLIPSEDYNMHFLLVKIDAGDQAGDLGKLAVDELKKIGAKNIDLVQATATGNNRAWIHGNFFLDGMTLKEAKEEDLEEAIEKHDELNQKIFNGDELDSEVKDKLLEIVDKFKENLAEDDVKLDVKDVVIVGSSVSYNYTKDSDIDLHIISDLSAYPNQEELAAKLYNAYKSLFNNKYDPTIYGINVEIYVEPEGMKANSKGRYSLFNGWVDKPEKEDVPEVPDIKGEYKEWEAKAKACETAEEIDSFMDDVYKLRQSSLLSEGEFGKGNLIFKELRNNNILQDLKDKKVELENKEMSLEEDKNIELDPEVLEEASEEDNRAKALADYLDISVEAVDNEDDNEYTTPEGDYLVLNDSEADEYAKNSVLDLIDDLGLDAFSEDFQEYVLRECIDQDAINEFIEEEIDYYGSQEEDAEMVSFLTNLNDYEALDYIEDLLGEKEFNKWLIEQNAIDYDAIVDEAIYSDGRGHFISMYDGDEIELGKDLFAYRIN